MQQRSAPCFLCCHLDSSTHIVLVVSSAVTCTLELRCSMYELSIFLSPLLHAQLLNSSTPQLNSSSPVFDAGAFCSLFELLKPGVRCSLVFDAATFCALVSLLLPGPFNPGDKGISFRFFVSSALQLNSSSPVFDAATFCPLFPLLSPVLLNSGVQCMSFRFFVSSAPPSTPQLLKFGVQCMNVLLLVSSAVT